MCFRKCGIFTTALAVWLLCASNAAQAPKVESAQMNNLDMYRTHSKATDPGNYSFLYDSLPKAPRAILEQLDRVVLESYPIAGMTRDQDQDITVSTVGEMLRKLRARGNDLVTEGPVNTRFVGLCYHWSLLSASVLRTKGYACRVRCGFAPYLSKGEMGIDHTVVELWDPNEQKWVLIDPELVSVKPELSMKLLQIDEPLDPMNVSRNSFDMAATAWVNYRSRMVPDDFYGVMGDEPSHGFVRTSLIRDWLNVLSEEHEVSFNPRLRDLSEKSEDAFLDSVAQLMLDPDKNLVSLKKLSAHIDRE
jgi:hypothetical protein